MDLHSLPFDIRLSYSRGEDAFEWMMLTVENTKHEIRFDVLTSSLEYLFGMNAELPSSSYIS